MATLTGTPRKTLVLTLFVSALLPGHVAPQEPPVAFPTEVEQVTVDVVVTDEEGQPIADLAATDIEVYEDGVPQTTTSFDLFEAPAPPTEEAEAAVPSVLRSRVSSNADEEEMQGRTFVIIFDDVHLTSDTAGPARAAVAEFLSSETREGDQITLVAPGAGAWWSTRMMAGRDELLEMLDTQEGLLKPDMQPDRLSDYEAMRIYHYADSQVLREIHRKYANRGMDTAMTSRSNDPAIDGFSNEDPYVTAKATVAYNEANNRNLATLGAMERALAWLVRRQGRKSLILVSEGFIHDPQLEEFKRIVTASLRANTAIYFLNSRGLGPLRDQATAFSEESEGSASLARESGGFVMGDSDELALGLRRIADETRACYLIGYNPTNTGRDGKFREIEVRIPGRAGVDIRARKGYYALSGEDAVPVEEAGEDADLLRGLDSPYALDDIGLRMTHFVREETSPGTARVSVAAEVDVEDLDFEQREGEDVAALHFVMVAMSRDGGDHIRYDQEVDLKLTPETRAGLARTWLPIVRDFELEPGSYRAKIVLKDETTSRLGTVLRDFEVPEIDPLRFRVSTPVLSDTRAPAEAGQPGERLALMARREFAPEAALYCRFEVYGAARIEGSGRSRVTLDYEVRRSDGVLYTRQGPSPVEPASDGSLSPMIGFPLRAASPGDYAITMRVKDGLSGKTVDLREPFRVTGPTAPAQPVEE